MLSLRRGYLPTLLVKRQHHGETIPKRKVIPGEVKPFCPNLGKGLPLPRSALWLSSLQVSPVPYCSYARADADCSWVVTNGTVGDNGMGLVGRSTPLPPVRQTACCDPVMLSAVRQSLSDILDSRSVPRRGASSQYPTTTCLPHGPRCSTRPSGAGVSGPVRYNR